jgi:signal peptidase I
MTSPEEAPSGPPLAPARRGALSRFFFPAVNRWFLLRLSLVAALTALFFGFLCVPARIEGHSMEPTYRNGGFAFCWRPRFWIHPPKPGRVVMVRIAGRRLMYLKRVVATSNDTVEFRKGELWVNGVRRQEPYALGPCDWELPPRLVPTGHLYVIGDNRTMPIEEHTFGSVPRGRIEGGPAW